MWMCTTRVYTISLLGEMPWGSGGALCAPPDAVENPGWAPRSGAENPGQLHVSLRDSRAAFGRLENPWVDYQADPTASGLAVRRIERRKRRGRQDNIVRYKG